MEVRHILDGVKKRNKLAIWEALDLSQTRDGSAGIDATIHDVLAEFAKRQAELNQEIAYFRKESQLFEDWLYLGKTSIPWSELQEYSENNDEKHIFYILHCLYLFARSKQDWNLLKSMLDAFANDCTTFNTKSESHSLLNVLEHFEDMIARDEDLAVTIAGRTSNASLY